MIILMYSNKNLSDISTEHLIMAALEKSLKFNYDYTILIKMPYPVIKSMVDDFKFISDGVCSKSCDSICFNADNDKLKYIFTTYRHNIEDVSLYEPLDANIQQTYRWMRDKTFDIYKKSGKEYITCSDKWITIHDTGVVILQSDDYMIWKPILDTVDYKKESLT